MYNLETSSMSNIETFNGSTFLLCLTGCYRSNQPWRWPNLQLCLPS